MFLSLSSSQGYSFITASSFKWFCQFDSLFTVTAPVTAAGAVPRERQTTETQEEYGPEEEEGSIRRSNTEKQSKREREKGERGRGRGRGRWRGRERERRLLLLLLLLLGN